MREKLNKYSVGAYLEGHSVTVKFESINECEFVFISTCYDYTDKSSYTKRITFPTAGCEIPKEAPWKGEFRYASKVVKEELLHANGSLSAVRYDVGEWTIIIDKREDDIYARIEKAMKHLSTFCQKTKELF